MHPPHGTVALLLSIVLLGSACNESLKAPPRASPPGNFAATTADGCGVSYTMITYEEDSLMATYGIPPTQDTIAVCETWTGSDYAISSKVVGSSEFYVAVRDTVQQVSYAAGTIAGFDPAGGAIDGTVPVGGSGNTAGTVFGLIGADSATRQASFDAPYYAISATPTGITVQPGLSSGATTARAQANDPDSAKFKKHGLKRRGVRAFVNDMDEMPMAADGKRRFKRSRLDRDDIVMVDPATELIVGEETRFATGMSVRTRHQWSPTAEGWVQTALYVDSDEPAHDQVYPSHSSIMYTNIRVGGILQTSVGPPLK